MSLHERLRGGTETAVVHEKGGFGQGHEAVGKAGFTKLDGCRCLGNFRFGPDLWRRRKPSA
jgi:hypothetical protein